MSHYSTTPHVPLEGGINFRDVGGYRVRSGRSVRRGRVFRTGTLCYLTEADGTQLKQLGVRRIFDLRRLSERTQEPTCWPDAEVVSHTWDDGPEPPSVMRLSQGKATSAKGMRDAMIALYQALPNWMAPRLRDFLQILREEQTPTVIHCAAGKDRTGIAIAVLLHALGVSRDDILRDYLLTNDVGLERFLVNRSAARLGVSDAEHPLNRLDLDTRHALLIADTDYLEAAYRQIERDYGGMDHYLERALGVTSAGVDQLRKSLLD